MSNHQNEISTDEAHNLAVSATLEGFRGTGDPITHEAREALRDSILDTARWRRDRAVEFPNDSRNADAADMLIALAETVANVSRHLMIQYGVHIENVAIGMNLHETQSDLLRAVGFRAWPETAEQIVEEILEKAADLSADSEVDEADDA